MQDLISLSRLFSWVRGTRTIFRNSIHMTPIQLLLCTDVRPFNEAMVVRHRRGDAEEKRGSFDWLKQAGVERIPKNQARMFELNDVDRSPYFFVGGAGEQLSYTPVAQHSYVAALRFLTDQYRRGWGPRKYRIIASAPGVSDEERPLCLRSVVGGLATTPPPLSYHFPRRSRSPCPCHTQGRRSSLLRHLARYAGREADRRTRAAPVLA